jgi:hypothetical protein
LDSAPNSPLRMTGNKAMSGFSGQYLLLLVMFKLIWPQSTYCECILAFIANESDDARIFSEKDVSLALRKLGYTQKVIMSTVAYQAFTERNLNRRVFIGEARFFAEGGGWE